MTSNILTRLVWLAWAITILFAWWFIPPRIDDGIYLFPAISVLNNFPPGGIINGSIQPIFYIFPTQPFLHGIFFKFLGFLSIEPGINTYRVFNYSLVVLLFYLTHKLFSVIFDNPTHSRSATNISLILLGFSQFSTQFFVNRPEILALVFFIVGLISSIKFITKSNNSNLHVMTAFFSYGMSAVLHANFIILSGSIIIYLVWIMVVGHRMKYLKFLVAFFIPLALFLIWIFLNFEVAQDQLFGRVGHATSGSFVGAREMYSVIIGNSNNTFAHKLYLSIHMLTLLIAILFLLFCLFLKNKSYREDNRITNLFKILSLAILALFCLMESWPPNYLLISFLSIVSVVFYVTNLSFNKSSFIVSNYYKYIGKKFHSTPFLCLVSSLFILSLPVFHSLKVYAYDGYYYNHHKTRSELNNLLSGNEHIFINSSQLLPLYSDKINKDFSAIRNNKKENVHWYFPVHLSPSPKSQELMLQSIKNDVELMQGAVWGTLKEYFFFDENSNTACLTLVGQKHFIKIKGVKVLYEDRDNLFFLSESAKPSNKVSCHDFQKF